MAIFESGMTSLPTRRIGAGAGGAFVVGLLIWLVLYASGLFPWLGYAYLEKSSFGAGPVGVIGEDSAGTEWGLSTMVFVKGQEIVIEYDADIRAGSLWLYVYDVSKAIQGAGASQYIMQTGTGVWTWRVPKTGLYSISIGPSLTQGTGRGHDLSYSVWWGARPAR